MFSKTDVEQRFDIFLIFKAGNEGLNNEPEIRFWPLAFVSSSFKTKEQFQYSFPLLDDTFKTKEQFRYSFPLLTDTLELRPQTRERAQCGPLFRAIPPMRPDKP